MLRVAVLNEYPWLKRTDRSPTAPFEGPAWLLATEYARLLHVRLQAIPVGQDDKVPILATGAVDITIAPLLEVPARRKLVDFVTYSMSAQCLFGLAANSKVASADNIDALNRRDVTIAFITGSPQGEWLARRLPNAARRGVDGDPKSIADVATAEILAHRADVTTIDKFFFAGVAKATPGLVTVPKGNACLASRELPIPVGLGVAKHQHVFLVWLRAVADAMKRQVHAEELKVERAGS